MLTLIAFSLLLLQSSLDEVFNPRLRRGKLAKRTPQGRPGGDRTGRRERRAGGHARRGQRHPRDPRARILWRNPMTRLLNAENLRAAYRTPDGRQVFAVDDVSVYIEEGEVLGVAGESGCGKSTLGAILSLTTRPPLYVESGTLEIDGKRQELGRARARSRAPGVARWSPCSPRGP